MSHAFMYEWRESMKSDMIFFIELAASFLPFILFAYWNSKANIKQENRNRQYPMPVVAVVYSAVLLIFLNQFLVKLRLE